MNMPGMWKIITVPHALMSKSSFQAGRNVILEIEIQGAMKIKEKIPEALLVFVTPPTVEELGTPSHRQRNRNRTGDRTTDLQEPVKRQKEWDNMTIFLINDTVEECVDHLHQIIVSEHSRASRNAEFIADIQKQTKAFQK